MGCLKEEPYVAVREVDALLPERSGHDGGDVDLVLPGGHEELGLVVGEEPPEGLRIRQALALQGREPRCVPFERDPLVPLVVHERPAPIEENRAQHGRLG